MHNCVLNNARVDFFDDVLQLHGGGGISINSLEKKKISSGNAKCQSYTEHKLVTVFTRPREKNSFHHC